MRSLAVLVVLVLLIAIAACGPGTGVVDGDVIDADISCWPAWRDGSIVLGPARRLDEIDTAMLEAEPTLTSDDLSLFITQGTASSSSRRSPTSRPRVSCSTPRAPIATRRSRTSYRCRGSRAPPVTAIRRLPRMAASYSSRRTAAAAATSGSPP